MEIITQKYTYSFSGLGEGVAQRLDLWFPFREIELYEGFKYLGFILKLDSYGKID